MFLLIKGRLEITHNSVITEEETAIINGFLSRIHVLDSEINQISLEHTAFLIIDTTFDFERN